MHIMQSRRDFLSSVSAAGAAGLLGARGSLAEDGPPETTTLRRFGNASICQAPAYISEHLLRAEGFTDIRYVPDLAVDAVARGDIDFDLETAAWVAYQVDAGEPITALAGVMIQSMSLWGSSPTCATMIARS